MYRVPSATRGKLRLNPTWLTPRLAAPPLRYLTSLDQGEIFKCG